ncbi:hypothetical protein PS2_041 [Serratia phage PS2]|uniref:TET-Associated Glycosyltransferase domain-containing protein n=1 Tax=Serratia phage PS2 TaxID=1481112 RepID=A0A023W644_9CAUD|nr:beta-glucosyl-HMC-alpha-glucosyltransferase [Serratia phage PS2]AHY25291.1 hypothetical protein PS2_041 [Serratia phage PS2]
MQHIQFVIPSYQRPDNVLALTMFPEGHIPHIIVRPEEEEAYKKSCGHLAKIVPVEGLTGIADTRRAITEMYKGQRIWMLDDDTFITTTFIRERDNRRVSHNRKMTHEEYDQFLMEINAWMDMGYTHGHSQYPVFMMPGAVAPFKENSYGFTNTFYDLTVLDAEQIGYGTVDLCEDAYSYLKLITSGYHHLAVQKYIAITGKAGAAGGCSSIRDNARHNAALERIVQDFPNNAKFYDKKLKNGEYQNLFGGTEHTKRIRISSGSRKKSPQWEKLQEFEAQFPIERQP